MEGVNTTDDLTHTCWRDELWLRYNQLNSVTVLWEYFPLSPFYDARCNNQLVKTQGLDISKLKTFPSGVEYVVLSAQPPHLFVIKKQFRQGPDTVTAQSLYYVHTGTIYQAPTLHSAVLSRWKRCIHLAHKSFVKMRNDLDTLLEWRASNKTKRKDASTSAKPAFSKEDRERFAESSQILMATIKNFPATDVPALRPELLPDFLKVSEEDEGVPALSNKPTPKTEAFENEKTNALSTKQAVNSQIDLDSQDHDRIKRQKR